MDKTIKTIIGEDGRLKKVSNPKGIGQTYLEYLVDMPLDDKFKIRIAREKLGMCFPDEIIYYGEYD